MHQRLRHQHTALHAARELAHIGPGLVGQTQAFEQLVDPGFVVAHAEVARLEPQRLTHIEERVKHQLLRHHAQLTAGGLVVGLHVLPVHQHTTGTGAGEARQHTDQGRFPRTIRPQQTEELARLDVERHPLERVQFTACR